MRGNLLVIVQPWFTAFGHPAQSTLNTARTLGGRSDIHYLVEDPCGEPPFEQMANEIESYCPVDRFRTRRGSLPKRTLWAMLALARRGKRSGESVFFLDASLLVVAATWPLLKMIRRSYQSILMISLQGPEQVTSSRMRRYVVGRFLSRNDAFLYLRTEELADSWRLAYKDLPATSIDTLPSLEIPDVPSAHVRAPRFGRTHFGIVGQIRPGKSIDWLVPFFQEHPAAGDLHIVGEFSSADNGDLRSLLLSYPLFTNRFLPEKEMIALSESFDYLLVFYDNWDARMEAATLFIAARSGVPVLVYDEGWCGRIVRQFGCGIAVPRVPRPDASLFSRLPSRDSVEYKRMVCGIFRFKEEVSGPRSRAAFLKKMRLPDSPLP